MILPDCDSEILSGTASVRVFHRQRRSVRSTLNLLRAALYEFYNFRPDIVFCHSSFALLPLLLLRALSRKVKFLYCPHGWAGARDLKRKSRGLSVRTAESWLSSLADLVVNVSASDLNYAKRNDYRGSHVLIENAVKPASLLGKPIVFPGSSEDIHILFVGRLDYQKGVDILLSAFAAARGLRNDLHLHIVGEAVVDGLGDSLGTMPTDGVNFLGWVSSEEIDAYYSAADIVIIPSRWEGLPLVLPEALRNGTPVLVSDRSGMPDLIVEGKSGLSMALDGESVKNAILSLNKAQLRQMRPAALKLFHDRYHATRLLREIDVLYSVMASVT